MTGKITASDVSGGTISITASGGNGGNDDGDLYGSPTVVQGLQAALRSLK